MKDNISYTPENENKLFKKHFENLKLESFSNKLKILVVFIIILMEIILVVKLLSSNESSIYEDGDNIAIINFNGKVTHEYVDNIIKKFNKIKENKNKFKEVLFTINSPGGSPEASEELREYIKDFNNNVLPITGYIKGYALSGGYYIASSFPIVKSNKNSLVGSIGVIMPHFNFKPLADKIGVKSDNVSIGKHKQLIPLIGKVSKKQKEYLQNNILKETYKNFVSSVAINRNKKLKEIMKVSDANVYVATDKRIRGILIDEITTLTKIKSEYKKQYDSEVNFYEIKDEKKGVLSSMISNMSDLNININLNNDMSKLILE